MDEEEWFQENIEDEPKEIIPMPIETLKNSSNSKLIQIVESLPEDLVVPYTVMANNFLQDFKKNLYKSSMDLNTLYPASIDLWLSFLSHPKIRIYLDSFRMEAVEISANQSIQGGSSTSTALKQLDYARANSGNNNAGFIIMRLPEREADVNEIVRI